MDKILHDPKDPKLWELWYIPYNGSCRILSINRRGPYLRSKQSCASAVITVWYGLAGLEVVEWVCGRVVWEFPKIRGTLFWGPYNKDPTI